MRRSRRCAPSCSPAGRSRCCSPRSPATGWPRPRCGQWARCAARPRRSRASAAAGACPCRPPATSSRGSAGRSTRCSTGSRVSRARARLRGEREPRAAHAAGAAQGGAGAGAARGPHAPRSCATRVASAAGESDRLVQLAEDLLVLARADEGRLPVRPERLDTAELLASTARRFESRAAEAGRELRVVPGDGLDAARGPAARRAGAREPRGQRASRTAMARWSWLPSRRTAPCGCTCATAGPGFDPALDGHAFERFTRGDRARSRGGTGLGLAIVDAIARSHGGRAGPSGREDGGGADVWIELPGSHPDLIRAG